MVWLAIVGILYYLLLPFKIAVLSLLSILAPVLHLGHYVLSVLVLPLRLLGNFETIYIYLGVAAVIGLLAGFLLHITSSMFVSILNLKPSPEEKGPPVASVYAVKRQKALEDAWLNARKPGHQEVSENESPSAQKRYADWLEKDTRRRREDQGLLNQIILEEDDDSEY